MFRKQVKRKRYNLNLNLNEENTDSKKSKKKNKRRSIRPKDKEEFEKREITQTADILEFHQHTDEGDELGEDVSLDDDFLKNDPFVLHFNSELSPAILSAITCKPSRSEKINLSYPSLGSLQFLKLSPLDDDRNDETKLKLLGKKLYTKIPPFPEIYSELCWDKLQIKKQILENVKSNPKIANNEPNLMKSLLTIASNYHDIYFPEENFDNIEDIQFVYCTHVVNHVLKSRLKILHHNSKLFKKCDVPEEFRDQGLVRPTVLILLPFRETAHKVVKMMSSILLGDKDNIMNKKRFIDEFTGSEINMPEKNPKPADYQLLFTGNTDDNFRIGINVTKKCLKLYSDFYSSDIIIASPLGLRMLIGVEGEKNRDYDFLSSIELLIMDQSQIFVMQNWEHVLHIMSHMHLQPKEAHGTDLSRVRMWALNGWSKYYMQSLIFSTYLVPEISALFNNMLFNYGGKVTILNPVKSGSICQVAVHAPQVFHEVSTGSVTAAVDDRFEAFVSDILPQFKDSSMKHTLIFIPSYFDFVRLRNYFKKQEMKFVHICEYTQEKKIIRARSKLFHGETQFLLYTERFHFYRRIKLRGIRHIIFYQPPSNPLFYSEICNFLQDFKKTQSEDLEESDIDLSINTIYTKFDIIQMAAIVGTDRATKMLASDKTVHMFMSES